MDILKAFRCYAGIATALNLPGQLARMPGSHTNAMPLIIHIQAKTLGRYALVIGSSVLVGIAIFYGTAIVLDFLSHIVVGNREFGVGAGLIVVAAWLFSSSDTKPRQ